MARRSRPARRRTSRVEVAARVLADGSAAGIITPHEALEGPFGTSRDGDPAAGFAEDGDQAFGGGDDGTGLGPFGGEGGGAPPAAPPSSPTLGQLSAGGGSGPPPDPPEPALPQLLEALEDQPAPQAEGGLGTKLRRFNPFGLDPTQTVGDGWLVLDFAHPQVVEPMNGVCKGVLLANAGGKPSQQWSEEECLRSQGNGKLVIPAPGRWGIKYQADPSEARLNMVARDAQWPLIASWLMNGVNASRAKQPVMVSLLTTGTELVPANPYRTALLLQGVYENATITFDQDISYVAGPPSTTNGVSLLTADTLFLAGDTNVLTRLHGRGLADTANVLVCEWETDG